nr:hypothetical protein [Jeotgalibacillus malaysiensis]
MYVKAFRILSYIAAAVVLVNVGLRWFADIDLIGPAWFLVPTIILAVGLGMESYIDKTRGNKLAYFYFLASGIMLGFLVYEVVNQVFI